MFFDAVVKTLRQADTKVVGTRRCFLVDEDAFHRLLEAFEEYSPGTDAEVRRNGYENFLIRLSSEDGHEYAVCTKSRPILDPLWKEIHHESEVESETTT